MKQFFPTELFKEIFSYLNCVRTGIIVMEDNSLSVDKGETFFSPKAVFKRRS